MQAPQVHNEPFVLEDVFCSQKRLPSIYVYSGGFKATLSYHCFAGDLLRFRCSSKGCPGSHVIAPTNVSIFSIEKEKGKKKKLKWLNSPAMFSRESYNHLQCSTPHTCPGRDHEFINRASVQSFIRKQINEIPSFFFNMRVLRENIKNKCEVKFGYDFTSEYFPLPRDFDNFVTYKRSGATKEMEKFESLEHYRFHPDQLLMGDTTCMFPFQGDETILFCHPKIFQKIKDLEILRLAADSTCWHMVIRGFKTTTFIGVVQNKYGVTLSCPLAFFLHRSSTKESIRNMFENFQNLYQSLTDTRLESKLYVSDDEVSLYCSASELFGCERILCCNFHKSQNLKSDFTNQGLKNFFAKKEINPVKKFFYKLKNIIYFPEETFYALIQYMKEKVLPDYEITDKKRESNAIRKKLYIIVDLQKERYERSPERMNGWFDLIENYDLDKSNNRCEKVNGTLKAKLNMYSSSSPIRRIIGHKKAVFSICQDFLIQFNRQKYSKTKALTTTINYDKYYSACCLVKANANIEEIYQTI